MTEIGVSAPITPENYKFLQEHIGKQSGIVLDNTKHYLIEARLSPIAVGEGLRNLDELCAKLRQSASTKLRQRVVEAMTTNETYFFREPAQFEVLRDVIIPTLVANRGSVRRLSLWSAAASTGQEAYSLSMLLNDMTLTNWDTPVLGTDLSETVLEKARQGRYSQLGINRGLPASMLVRHFKKCGQCWQINPELQKRVSFQALDLRSVSSQIGRFDIVLCRNVLIYFDAATKAKVLEQITSTLNPGGYLLLGGSEVGLPIGPRFRRHTSDGATFYSLVD